MHLTLTLLAKIQRDLHIEVIVFDNNSEDMFSIENLTEAFPTIRFIMNKTNLGFGEANNLAVKEATSDNLLILNPDTVISKEVIEYSILKLENEGIGALAVKMIDGSGAFLSESKRGFPKLSSTIYKFIGLHRVFPRSRHFNHYYLGSDSNSRFIEVLAGACFFIPKVIYEEIGGFDKRFFMYGEDIDFSFQLAKKGYKIGYISDAEIIHFKGKSSSKTEWSYQSTFYNAMLVYWNKNFETSKRSLTTFLISVVLTCLKVMSMLKHLLISIFWPLMDAIVIYSSIAVLSSWWATCVKEDAAFFPDSFYLFILPLYTLVWVFSLFASSFYKNSVEIQRLFKGSTLGTILTLLLYFILPSEYKFSRGILILSIGFKFILPLIVRAIAQFFSNQKIQLAETALFNANLVPKNFNYAKFSELLKECSNFEIVNNDLNSSNIVIEVEEFENSEIIEMIGSGRYQSVWLYSSKGNYLIQSLGKNERENIIAEDTNLNIQNASSRLLKRGLDLGFSMFILCFSVIQLKLNSVRIDNALKVLFKGWTWISIDNSYLREKFKLKKGIYCLTKPNNPKFDLNYLRHYSVQKEFSVLLKQMFKL